LQPGRGNIGKGAGIQDSPTLSCSKKAVGNNELNHATVLISGKAGKKIAPGPTVTVQVRNNIIHSFARLV
jgi:hypothetical protein